MFQRFLGHQTVRQLKGEDREPLSGRPNPRAHRDPGDPRRERFGRARSRQGFLGHGEMFRRSEKMTGLRVTREGHLSLILDIIIYKT